MSKPSMVILYTDPVAKVEARLCYWDTPGEKGRVSREVLGSDALGEPAWLGGAGHIMCAEVVLAHLLMHVARGGTTYGPNAIIDLRNVKIPCAPL